MLKITKKILIFLLLTTAFESLAFEDLKKIRVTATAYNSLPEQTDDDPNIAAWNNRISPADKNIIAVSRDLLREGLTNGVKVKIVGLDGLFTVRDKMNKRWRRRIDIYMGIDKDNALSWGKRRVIIVWNPKDRYKGKKSKKRIRFAKK